MLLAAHFPIRRGGVATACGLGAVIDMRRAAL
jgi:hypothetical protein